jgi:hypothetical protein
MEPARDGIAHEPCTVNEALLLCPRKHSWDLRLQPQIISVSAVAAFLLKPSFAAAAHCLFPSASGDSVFRESGNSNVGDIEEPAKGRADEA